MVRGFLARYALPLVYLSAFGAMSVVYLVALSAGERAELVAWASTNLDNLPRNPVGTLVVSALLAEDSHLPLLVMAAVALFAVTRRFGNLRALVLVVGGHVIGTLAAQGLALVRLRLDQIPDSVRSMSDVGPSLVISSALVAAIAFGPGIIARVLAVIAYAVLAPYLFEGLTSADISAVGHVTAMVVGGAAGALFWLTERTRTRPPTMAPAFTSR
jgi:hypothetical protein